MMITEQRWRQTHLRSFSSTSAIFFFWHQLLISACELLSEGQRVNTRKVEAAQPKSNFPSENEFSYCLISRVLTGLLIWQHSVFHREESKKSLKKMKIFCVIMVFFSFLPCNHFVTRAVATIEDTAAISLVVFLPIAQNGFWKLILIFCSAK